MVLDDASGEYFEQPGTSNLRLATTRLLKRSFLYFLKEGRCYWNDWKTGSKQTPQKWLGHPSAQEHILEA